MLLKTGFVQGKYSACVFYREQEKVRIVLHGDDFTVLGESKSLDWFGEVMQQRMDVKFKGRLERGKPGAVRILSRIVTGTEKGLECEADQRHAEIIVKDLELPSESKGFATLGVNEKDKEGGE